MKRFFKIANPPVGEIEPQERTEHRMGNKTTIWLQKGLRKS
jgi:hypothetical protein